MQVLDEVNTQTLDVQVILTEPIDEINHDFHMNKNLSNYSSAT